ncbi:hypothetical protein [Parasediminibacterium sp. JCM 36343]|uniref:hypothetical protein n=1 Tax=Parasediminibacterium sp. JCM 36343 TaxID=3374279 RepID=UPI0039788B9E
MTIKSKQLFILIGDDMTGKTTLQKLLIEKICGQTYDRLPTNLRFNITHPEIKRKYQNISFANRSYQEKIDEYGTVDEYFQNHFSPADISIISSHLDIGHITEMIRNGRQRLYNVTGIFFSNSIDSNQVVNSQISLLEWEERLVIENVTTEDERTINRQLNAIADNFVVFISNRTSVS